MSILSSAIGTATGGATIWIALGAFLLGAGTGGYAAYHWQEDALEREHLAHIADMKAVSDAAAAELARHQNERDALLAKLAASDEKHFQELADVKAEKDTLRAAAAAGSLSIATTADGGCSVPSAPSTASMGHATPRRRAFIQPSAAKALVAIAAAADRYREQLLALQAYARDVSAPAH